ncbi:hypothetical protein LUZ61_006881 [Rhynchospora tenuis]|uniref:WRKY domain-containing protein n=1 Tax=Rhynchospora tenuis TaxID=198213 RepID=A0AAD5ZSF6_9POAL|nr:hypothetical protein LUZ61_006881 [Rhynchospora tenuis]
MDNKKDASRSTNHFECDHRMAIEGIKRGQELTNQLKDALGFSATSEPVSKLFHGIHSGLNNALSGLQYASNAPSSKSRESKKNSLEEDSLGVNLRRRNIVASIASPTPHYDGHQWRKYGEKLINNSKHERCYYRCTYSKELKCPATKTVQREDSNTDPPMYSVIYYNHHICNHKSSEYEPFVIDSTNFSTNETSSSTASQETASFEAYASPSMELHMLDEFGMETDQHRYKSLQD